MRTQDLFDEFARQIFPPDLPDSVLMPYRDMAQIHIVAQDRSFETRKGRDSLVYLAHGATKMVAHASAEREQVIAFHFSGDVFSLPGHDAHSHSLYALRNSDLVIFPYADFEKLSHGHLGILRQLLNFNRASLQRCRDKVIALGRKTATERIASFLLAMAERIGLLADGQVTLDLPMSRRDIADSLGMTIETVSRQLTLLRESRLIETVGRSRIILFSVPELEARAGFLRDLA